MDSYDMEHLEEVYYSCSLCEKSYTHSNDLKEHQKIHMKGVYEEKSENIPTGVSDFSKTDKETINKTNDVQCSYNIYELEQDYVGIKEEVDTDNDDSHDAVELSKEEYKYDEAIECEEDEADSITSSDWTENQTIVKEGTAMDLNYPTRRQPLTENQCAVCNKIFKFQRDLVTHARDLHPNGKAFKCNNCDLRYSSIPSLSMHNQKVHKQISRTHVCKFCCISFNGKLKLKLHLNGHKTQLYYPCSLCENVYNHERGWTRHQMSHFSLESFKCKLCPKAFTRIDSLKRHQRVHTGERPYSCNICGKPYAEKRNLFNHQKSHIVPKPINNDWIEKPYGCKFCSKSFSFESHLNYHLTSHTDERPFSCSVCKKVYKHRKSLNKHLKIHVKRSLEKFSNKDLNILEMNKEHESTKTIIENNSIHANPMAQELDSHYKPCLDDNVKTVDHQNISNYSEEICQNNQLLSREKEEENSNLKNPYYIKQESYPNTDDLETENTEGFSIHNIEPDVKTQLQLEQSQFRGLNHYYKLQDTNERLKYACFLCEKSFSEIPHLKKHQKIHLKLKSKNTNKVPKIKEEITSTVVREKIHQGLNDPIPHIAVSNNIQYLLENNEMRKQSLNTIGNLNDSKYPEDFYHNAMPLDNNGEINCLENTFYIKEELSWHSDSQELLNVKNVEELGQTYELALANTSATKENFVTNDLQPNQKNASCKIIENCKRIGTKVLLAENKCGVCYKVFNFQKDLIKHVQRLHRNLKAFKCYKCNKRYSKMHTLLMHSKVHRVSERNITQESKYFLYKNKSSLNKNSHQSSIKYSCKFCSKKFDLIGQLRYHLKLHTHQNLIKHSCKFCSKKFDLIGQLRYHLKLHTAERTYSCSLCNNTYLHRQGLHRHLRLHSADRSYACSSCEKTFNEKAAWKKHQKMHIKPKELKAYPCTYCYKSFGTESSLTLHLKLHTGERPHPCDRCEKSYIQKKDLNKHKRKVHLEDTSKSDEKNIFFCKHCPKSFDQLGNLKCHLRSHSDERPFACHLCDKAYKHNSHLKQHQKIHLDTKEPLKKYVCNICSKSFDLMGRLENHLRTHSEKREFVCSFCEKSFKYKCDLNRHLKLLHSGENPFCCSLCDTSYPDKRSFNAHQKIHPNSNSKMSDKMPLEDETENLKPHITGIKEELYSDSECHQDDMETKSVLEIFKTEFIEEEDIINSAVRLEDNSTLTEDSNIRKKI